MVNFHGPLDALSSGWKKRGMVNFHGPLDALSTGWKRDDSNTDEDNTLNENTVENTETDTKLSGER